MGRAFITISAAALALAVVETPAQPWMAGKCELSPISPLKFRYPSCEDIGWTTLSPWYYLGFFGVTIPLNVFVAQKRIGLMEGLIGAYNRSP